MIPDQETRSHPIPHATAKDVTVKTKDPVQPNKNQSISFPDLLSGQKGAKVKDLRAQEARRVHGEVRDGFGFPKHHQRGRGLSHVTEN